MPKVRWVVSYGFCSKFRPLFSSAKIWKSVKKLKISQSYRQFKGGNFFWDTVCISFCLPLSAQLQCSYAMQSVTLTDCIGELKLVLLHGDNIFYRFWPYLCDFGTNFINFVPIQLLHSYPHFVLTGSILYPSHFCVIGYHKWKSFRAIIDGLGRVDVARFI